MIASMARSGTQLLSALLGSHPDIVTHGEVLNRFDDEIWDDATIVERCYRQSDQLRQAAVGITVLCEQFGFRPLTFPNLLAVPNMHVIVLERRDQLSRLRSMLQADTTSRWEVDARPPKDLPAVRMPPADTLQALRQATLFHDQLRQIAVPLVWVTYEELCENQACVLGAIWSFLGVASPGSISAPTFRQECRSLAETVKNLDEVRECLVGTRYEHSLKEG